jgi:hypothetical protein
MFSVLHPKTLSQDKYAYLVSDPGTKESTIVDPADPKM